MKRTLLLGVIVVAGLALLVAPALASAQTFTVHPSGGNDTKAIQKAFDAAVKAGPGSTVQLSAGHFYTNNILVKNFDGYFKGAGEGRNGTVIDCLRGLYPTGTYPDGRPVPGVRVLPHTTYFPFLVGFEGGNVRACDMSFDITAASPAEPWSNGDPQNPVDYLLAVVVVADNASSSFEGVSLTAGGGHDAGCNSDEGVLITGFGPYDPVTDAGTAVWTTSGTDSICGCTFEGSSDGVQVMGLTRGRATISGNVFDNLNLCCMVNDSSASQVTISRNRMSAMYWDDVVLWQGFQAAWGGGAHLPSLPGSRYLITDNQMLGTVAAGGVEVRDASAVEKTPFRLDATISDNTITLDNGGWDGGIDGVYAKGVLVSHNRISGTGLAGIDVGSAASLWGIPSGPDFGWQLIDNDVSHLTLATQWMDASNDPIWGAPIWLGTDATDCTVIGGCAPTRVLDEGTSNHLKNVIVMH